MELHRALRGGLDEHDGPAARRLAAEWQGRLTRSEAHAQRRHTHPEECTGSTEWKYYRHHKSAFLEIGLVKIAFLWELVQLGFDVLISDLDIVWLSPHWERWMTYRQPRAPLEEASDSRVVQSSPKSSAAINKMPVGVGHRGSAPAIIREKR